jgi:hypothetical protein
MKKVLSFSAILFLTFSCSTFQYQRFDAENVNGSACMNPTYVATMSKSAPYEPSKLTLFTLLKDARAAHGEEVTIQNVRYDLENKKIISVIYDVVKCK